MGWRRSPLTPSLTLVATLASVAAAQEQPQPASGFTAFGVNALIGGTTSAVQALLEHRDPARAFATGAAGGAIHFAGKYVASRRGALSGWTGLAVAATGTSIVANAGAGMAPLQEVSLPVGSLRIRVTPLHWSGRLAVNAFETLVIAHTVMRDGVRVDWSRSVQTGTLVMNTWRREIVHDGTIVEGVTFGPVMVLGPRAQGDATDTWKHETTHIQQNWFMQDAWNRPLEKAARARIPGARFIPSWLELGAFTPIITGWDEQLWTRRSGLRNLMEKEAELLERR